MDFSGLNLSPVSGERAEYVKRDDFTAIRTEAFYEENVKNVLVICHVRFLRIGLELACNGGSCGGI